MKVPIHDWDRVRTDFVEGIKREDGEIWWPNLREISEYHDLNYTNVRTRGGDERWYDERQSYQNYLELVRREARAKELAEIGVAFDGEALDAARKGLHAIVERLDQMETLGDFTANEAVQLARAAAHWQAVGRKALGERDLLTPGVSGVVGGPVPVDVRAELTRDDPERLAEFLDALDEAGVLRHVMAELESGEVIDVDGESLDARPYPGDGSVEPEHSH